MRLKRWAVSAALAATIFLAPRALADTRREGKADLLFGAGSLSSQEASIDGFSSVDAGDGSTFDLRFRFHFTSNLAIEVAGTAESERTHLKSGGIVTDSLDTDTSFFAVNALFDLIEGPISPFVSLGVGNYDHRANGLGISEHGSLFDAAAGIDGRTRGRLIWSFEARLLHYEFADFNDNWNRIEYTGQLGFHF
jgi:hypothetical protein